MHACVITLVLLPASANQVLISPSELISGAWLVQDTC